MLTLFKTDWRELWGNLPLPTSGTVYTKPEIVSLILDLAGYDPSKLRLAEYRLLEPCCGDGAFLWEIVERLIASEIAAGSDAVEWSSPSLDCAIMAVDISEDAVTDSRNMITELLIRKGCPHSRAEQLAKAWTMQTDFLLHNWGRDRFDFVVGNPPYVRLEDIPGKILQQYREAYATATDRADLYIPFFEHALSLLSTRGALAFICANRFAKNQYGAALRSLIAQHYHVRHYINLEHTQPFLSKVSAYPAVIVIDRQCGAPTHAATVDNLDENTLHTLRFGGQDKRDLGYFEKWYSDGSPWVSTSRDQQADLTLLKKNLPTIEESAPGTRIGIGVATGADDIFILTAKRGDIENNRQLPLIMAQDISSEKLSWSNHWLLNPFSEENDGSLVDFRACPGLGDYFQVNAGRLKLRHCAKNRLAAWYRTIDRIWPALTATPKLVIPDIQPGGVIGYDSGKYYPHHNVYWITSKTWDLRVLQTILRSSFVTEQIRAHSVAMRGGSLRYQAQNLRRIRIPAWADLSDMQKRALAHLADTKTSETFDKKVRALLFPDG